MDSGATTLPPADRERHRYIHSIRDNYGTWGERFAPDVLRFVKQVGATSLLDYGCGKGLLAKCLAKERPDLVVMQYDPAIAEHDRVPEPADLVVCTDVIPLAGSAYIPPLLDDLDRCALRALFIVIPMYAIERVPDYHNDIVIQSKEAWVALLEAKWPGGVASKSRAGGNRLQYTWMRPS